VNSEVSHASGLRRKRRTLNQSSGWNESFYPAAMLRSVGCQKEILNLLDSASST
jgi:hypothetical protein